jgi:hypothetical protein
MEIKVQITVKSEVGQPEVVREVARLERGSLRSETLGLSLAEARAILGGLEKTMAERQAATGSSSLAAPVKRILSAIRTSLARSPEPMEVLNSKGQICQQAIDRLRDLLRIQWLQKIIHRC